MIDLLQKTMKRNLMMGMFVVSTLLTQFGPTRAMGGENEEDQKLFEAGQKWECKWYDSGAKPSFQLTSEGTESVGQLTYDFSGGGTYVVANTTVSIPAEYKELRFFVKSATKATILVQFMNSLGVTYQLLPSYQDAGKWQEIQVVLGGKTTNRYKGDLHLLNDEPWDFPLNMLQLGLSHHGKDAESGDVFFKKVILLK